MRAVFGHLWKANQIYGYDPATLFKVWWPTALDFGRIVNPRAFADPKTISNVLDESLDNANCSVIDFWNARVDAGDRNLGTARMELTRRWRRELLNRSEVARAKARYERALDQKTVQRCFQAADEAANPLESGLWFLSAAVMQHCQETDELTRRTDGDRRQFSDEHRRSRRTSVGRTAAPRRIPDQTSSSAGSQAVRNYFSELCPNSKGLWRTVVRR